MNTSDASSSFCWGGRQVWLYAAHNSDLRAGVAWYGPLQRPKTSVSPNDPIDLIKELNAPILGLYGGADPGIPIAEFAALRIALKALGKPSEIVIYPDTPHGFNADYRPSYRPVQAPDGWKRMRAWFKQYGGGLIIVHSFGSGVMQYGRAVIGRRS